MLLGTSVPASDAGRVNDGRAESGGRTPVLEGTAPVPVGFPEVRKPLEPPVGKGRVPLDGIG